MKPFVVVMTLAMSISAAASDAFPASFGGGESPQFVEESIADHCAQYVVEETMMCSSGLSYGEEARIAVVLLLVQFAIVSTVTDISSATRRRRPGTPGSTS